MNSKLIIERSVTSSIWKHILIGMLIFAIIFERELSIEISSVLIAAMIIYAVWDLRNKYENDLPRIEINNEAIVYYSKKETKTFRWDDINVELTISHNPRYAGNNSLIIISKQTNEKIVDIDMSGFKSIRPWKFEIDLYNKTGREIKLRNTWY